MYTLNNNNYITDELLDALLNLGGEERQESTLNYN
jgi:hypothetical protein